MFVTVARVKKENPERICCLCDLDGLQPRTCSGFSFLTLDLVLFLERHLTV